MFVTFISEFDNTQNSFSCGTPFGLFWSVKYLFFWPKATNLDSSSYFSRKQTSWGYLKSILCFAHPRRIQIPIFVGSSSWTIYNIIAYCQQNLCVRFAIYNDLFTLSIVTRNEKFLSVSCDYALNETVKDSINKFPMNNSMNDSKHDSMHDLMND